MMRTDKPKVLQSQVGGDHYAKYPIQPIEYIHANKLDFEQGNIVKLITRFRDKGGAQDLRKIKQYADILLALEYGEDITPELTGTTLNTTPADGDDIGTCTISENIVEPSQEACNDQISNNE